MYRQFSDYVGRYQKALQKLLNHPKGKQFFFMPLNWTTTERCQSDPFNDILMNEFQAIKYLVKAKI